MARFIAYARGRAKSTASRLGTPGTGAWAKAQGWNIGGRVDVNAEGDSDVVEFTLTPGSNGAGSGQTIARFRFDGKRVKRIPLKVKP